MENFESQFFRLDIITQMKRDVRGPVITFLAALLRANYETTKLAEQV